jgi:hypothetical protein
MRFYVERNVLADDSGKIVPVDDPTRISYTILDVVDVETAVRTIAANEDTEILFDVYHMSPEQAMATVRHGRRVLTLHAFPEEEAQDRILRSGEGHSRGAWTSRHG